MMNDDRDGGFFHTRLGEKSAGFFQFPKDKFEPQFEGLVDDDEVKLVV
jgi:hypothetical protein